MDDQINANSPSSQSEALAQLVKELGIDMLPQDKQNELLIKMTEVLLKRIFLETMERLGEKGREEYAEMTAEGKEPKPEEIEEFFKQRISNYEEMVQNVINEFKDEMTAAEDYGQQTETHNSAEINPATSNQ